jgi:hypothetical protein
VLFLNTKIGYYIGSTHFLYSEKPPAVPVVMTLVAELVAGFQDSAPSVSDSFGFYR